MTINNEQWWCGVDGGGTSTSIILGSGTNYFVKENLPSIKPCGTMSMKDSSRSLLRWIQQLCIEHKTHISSLSTIVVGMAGIWTQNERQEYRNALVAGANATMTILPLIHIISDVELAYSAVFESKGILALIGTGSIVALKSSEGILQRAGGYGFADGDTLGGTWIGTKLVRLCTNQYDAAGGFSDVGVQVLEALNLPETSTPRELVQYCTASYGSTSIQLSQLAPIVLTNAKRGNVYHRIIETGVNEILDTIRQLSNRWYRNTTNHTLCLAGSIGGHRIVRKEFEQQISGINNIILLPTTPEPVYGAAKFVHAAI